ncbi:hypothetical protein F2P81_014055 [Scophthalmus maximus]|uniref:Uncharacterized protein n=1 Tax=Scophthalmus maximus TaxID=52904 RepID=A0A6A4SMW2_SCOMX|nr:hypothetical protein F2P81_014055 [Scophthalmus maximus]
MRSAQKKYEGREADYETDTIFGSVGAPLLEQKPSKEAECTDSWRAAVVCEQRVVEGTVNYVMNDRKNSWA